MTHLLDLIMHIGTADGGPHGGNQANDDKPGARLVGQRQRRHGKYHVAEHGAFRQQFTHTIETLAPRYDIVLLVALLVVASMFIGVCYHAYTRYAEIHTGRATWGQFGLTVAVGAILLVVGIWLLTKATGVL